MAITAIIKDQIIQNFVNTGEVKRSSQTNVLKECIEFKPDTDRMNALREEFYREIHDEADRLIRREIDYREK